MNAKYLNILPKPELWFLGIAVSLLAIYLNLIWKIDSDGWLNNSIIFWVAICYLLWKKRNSLRLESGIISSIVGTLIIGLGLLKSTQITGPGPVINALPFIYALGLAVLASGFQGLKQYWQELLLFFIWSAPKIWLIKPIDNLFQVSELTAKLVSFILWYLGFNPERQGLVVNLPEGGITITSECAGILTMFWLLQMAIIFLAIFPTDIFKKVLIPVLAVLIGFAVNVFRLIILAFFVSDREVFNYWHSGDGSGIFRIICILAFGVLCLLTIQQQESESVELQ